MRPSIIHITPALVALIALPIVTPLDTARGQDKGPPSSSATCPRVAYGVLFTCFGPEQLRTAEHYITPAPYDPSSIVASETGMALTSVLVVWCTFREQASHKCHFRKGKVIYYFYGSDAGVPSLSSGPPYVRISEQPVTRNRLPPGVTIQQRAPWRLVTQLRDRKIVLVITANIDIGALLRIAFSIRPLP